MLSHSRDQSAPGHHHIVIKNAERNGTIMRKGEAFDLSYDNN